MNAFDIKLEIAYFNNIVLLNLMFLIILDYPVNWVYVFWDKLPDLNYIFIAVFLCYLVNFIVLGFVLITKVVAFKG
jgi:hypothetical protein